LSAAPSMTPTTLSPTSSIAPSLFPTPFTVGSNSCLGCYSCINSTAGTSRILSTPLLFHKA
jgi:hypothetical protein